MKIKLPTLTTSQQGPGPAAFLIRKRFSSKGLARPVLRSIRPGRIAVPALPLTAKIKISTWLTLAALALYLAVCAYVVVIWAAPEALGSGDVRLGPDSVTYYTLGEGIQESRNKLPLLALGSNLLGPIALVILLGNPFAVAAFNATLLIVALKVSSTIEGVRFHVFAALLLLDAETLSAVTTVNKEIFALFSAVLLAKYLDAGKKSWLLLSVVCISAVMARWEQLAVILVFLGFERMKTFKSRPVLAVLLVVLAITVLWPFALRSIDSSGFDHYTEGANTMAVFNAVQAHFGYILVVIPKVAMNLIGAGTSPDFWFKVWPTMDHSDVQNSFLIRLHELITTCVILFALLTRRLSLRSPLLFFCALYLVVTCANLFVQSRYDYPVYVLLCLTIAKERPRIQRTDGAGIQNRLMA